MLDANFPPEYEATMTRMAIKRTVMALTPTSVIPRRIGILRNVNVKIPGRIPIDQETYLSGFLSLLSAEPTLGLLINHLAMRKSNRKVTIKEIAMYIPSNDHSEESCNIA